MYKRHFSCIKLWVIVIVHFTYLPYLKGLINVYNLDDITVTGKKINSSLRQTLK